MRFITISTKNSGNIAINVDNITSIQIMMGEVYIVMKGGAPIATKFTTIEHAVDYVQRAASVTLNSGE